MFKPRVAMGMMGLLLVLGSGVALLRAQDVGREPTADPPAPGTRGTPFQLYSADEGAIAYTDLVAGPVPALTDAERASGTLTLERYQAISAETRASVDDTAAWAEGDHSPAVHQAWAGYSAAMGARAALEATANEAGLAGIGEVGVVP